MNNQLPSFIDFPKWVTKTANPPEMGAQIACVTISGRDLVKVYQPGLVGDALTWNQSLVEKVSYYDPITQAHRWCYLDLKDLATIHPSDLEKTFTNAQQLISKAQQLSFLAQSSQPFHNESSPQPTPSVYYPSAQQYLSNVGLEVKEEANFSAHEEGIDGTTSQAVKQYQTLQIHAQQLRDELTFLIQRAKLESSGNDYTFNIEMEHSNVPSISISVTHLAMGYSFHDLLCHVGIYNKEQQWNGELKFHLLGSDIEKLTGFMALQKLRLADFSKNISDLLGTDSQYIENFVQLGQKSMDEVRKSIQHKVTDRAAFLLKQVPDNFECLLLGSISLNLDQHIDRDFIKKEIEAIYRLEHMKSLDGQNKQFVLDTYRTNLDSEQIKKIIPRLNKLVKFVKFVKTLAKEPSVTVALDSLTSPQHPLRLESREDIQRLYYETAFRTSCRFVPDARSSIADLSKSFGEINLDQDESVESLTKQYQNSLDAFLNKRTIVFFQNRIPSYKPTGQDITNLYGTMRKKTYGQTSNLFRDLGTLFRKMQDSPAIKLAIALNPYIGLKIQALKETLETRLTTQYHNLPEEAPSGSKKLIRQTIEYLETYVALIVNQHRSGITQSSIETSLAQLLGFDLIELKQGCDVGLNGLLANLLTTLASTPQGAFDNQMMQLQKDLLAHTLTEFEKELRGLGPNYLAELHSYLSLNSQPSGSYDKLSVPAQRIFYAFLNKYTPAAIYQHARSHFENAFWMLSLNKNSDENNEKFYELFRMLGFGEDRAILDQQYRVNGNPENSWQYAFIEQDLPLYLPAYLAKMQLLLPHQDRTDTLIFQKEGEPERKCSLPKSPPPSPVRAPVADWNNARAAAFVNVAPAPVPQPVAPPPLPTSYSG